jgi:hypothetical protein
MVITNPVLNVGISRPAHRERHEPATFIVLSFIIITLCLSTLAKAANYSTITIVHPAAGESVSGTYNFAASTTGTFSTLEFRIGSKEVGFLIPHGSGNLGPMPNLPPPPLNVTWNTGYASDGSYALQVIGRDSSGNVVMIAQQVFTINNHGNALAVTSPDLTQPLSGSVLLNMRGTDSQYYPAIWMINIDGELAVQRFTDHTGQSVVNEAASVDTTRYPNGTHELYIGMHSDYWPGGPWPGDPPNSASYYNWRGGFERVVTIDNGHTLMDVSANYLQVYLTPGGYTMLTCRQLFTDNTSGACMSPNYASSDSSVARVSSTGSLIAGAQVGFATITLSDSGKSTDIHVWVRANSNIPHFSGSGQMLDTYTPGSSLFVIAPFLLDPDFLSSDPTLTAAVHDAGVNTLQSGIYLNPRDLTFTFAAWQQYYDANVEPRWRFAANNGFHILATGDEIARNIGGEGWWTMNWAPAKAAVQYAFQGLAESGVGISVDMIDEASSTWGGTPTPPGIVGGPSSFQSISCSGSICTVSWPNNPVSSSRFPSGTNFALNGSSNSALNTPSGAMFTATNVTADSFDFAPVSSLHGTFTSANDPGLEFVWWAGNIGGCPSQPCDPPVPNDALVRIASWIHETVPTLPISWPALGTNPPDVQAAWMGGNSISDYASHYWSSFKERPTYSWSSGIQEETNAMTEAFYSRQSSMMLDRPQLILASISGPAYTKNTPGEPFYTPPDDTLDVPGVNDAVITSQIMTAAALGAAGVRLYQFEPPGNEGSRASAPLGSYVQTGANPLANDPIVQGNWRAMSSAANALTRVLAPYVLGTALNSPAMGRNIITAARQSADGSMLMVINDNDWERTLFVDFTPYASGSPISRYLIDYNGTQNSTFSTSSGESIDLKGGETVVYLFGQQTTSRGSNKGPNHQPIRGLHGPAFRRARR